MSDRVCDVVIATRNRPDALAPLPRGSASPDGRRLRRHRRRRLQRAAAAPVVAEDRFAGSTTVRRHAARSPARPPPATPASSRRRRVVVFVDDDVVADRRLRRAPTSPRSAAAATASVPIVSCGPFVAAGGLGPDAVEPLGGPAGARRRPTPCCAATTRRRGASSTPATTASRRRVFRPSGGFDETFKRAEDDEFALRLDDRRLRVPVQSRRRSPGTTRNRSLEAWLAIPRAYAYFDVQIDRLHPDAGYLAAKKLRARAAPAAAAGRPAAARAARGARRSAVAPRRWAAKLLYRPGRGRACRWRAQRRLRPELRRRRCASRGARRRGRGERRAAC